MEPAEKLKTQTIMQKKKGAILDPDLWGEKDKPDLHRHHEVHDSKGLLGEMSQWNGLVGVVCHSTW